MKRIKRHVINKIYDRPDIYTWLQGSEQLEPTMFTGHNTNILTTLLVPFSLHMYLS